MKASLNVADGIGRTVPLPKNVRLYFLSGFQHGGNNPPPSFPGPAGMCENSTNPNYHGPTVRALLMALNAWADRGVDPPESNYPGRPDGTLVTLEAAQKAFPKIPGVTFPPMLNSLELLDFGPLFDAEGGVLTILPPLLGPNYEIFVPRPDADGLDIAGIRPIEIRAPLGTNVGWNVRAPGFRAPNLCGLNGSCIPFATTKTERLATGDPRRSLQERYNNHEGYVDAVERAAAQLVRERFSSKKMRTD